MHATVYPLANKDDTLVGQDQTIETVYEDTLYDLARKYSLGSEELIRVNPGVDPWIPGAGKQIIVPGRHILPPGPREGIVVNLPEHRLYYYPKAKRDGTREVITYPVSIGKMDWRTPLGLTHVIQKQKDPVWYPPESVRKEHAAAGDPLPAVVPAGPDNPLGQYAMRLAAGNGTYLIHGTNNPIAVGLAVTHGCVRMYPDDVAALFPWARRCASSTSPSRWRGSTANCCSRRILPSTPKARASSPTSINSRNCCAPPWATEPSPSTGITHARFCRRRTASSPRWDSKRNFPTLPNRRPPANRPRIDSPEPLMDPVSVGKWLHLAGR